MPSKAAIKLLERMRQSKAGWKRRDLDALYEGYGFVISAGGSHDRVSHPDYPELPITSLPRHTRVHPYIVAHAIKLIDKLEALGLKSDKQEASDEEKST